ncbi:hypothetical protein BV898_08519 [Hypsibius exemplaris]|uniref:Uncharacterized protein n=1 Tax=Hypsibius exemplaris TaxID=2072580 RepID=A0A1W0WQD8_HYPEX|nr:hypothetical protein BV898_08519 [Hypsibius exemplaris]
MTPILGSRSDGEGEEQQEEEQEEQEKQKEQEKEEQCHGSSRAPGRSTASNKYEEEMEEEEEEDGLVAVPLKIPPALPNHPKQYWIVEHEKGLWHNIRHDSNNELVAGPHPIFPVNVNHPYLILHQIEYEKWPDEGLLLRYQKGRRMANHRSTHMAYCCSGIMLNVVHVKYFAALQKAGPVNIRAGWEFSARSRWCITHEINGRQECHVNGEGGDEARFEEEHDEDEEVHQAGHARQRESEGGNTGEECP